MANAPGWYPDPQQSGLERYWFGTEWSKQTRPILQVVPTGGQGSYNRVTTVLYRGGWVGLIRRENQTRALTRAMAELNAQGRMVVAAVDDRWSVWATLGWAFVAVITLGWYVRHPNVVLITAPR